MNNSNISKEKRNRFLFKFLFSSQFSLHSPRLTFKLLTSFSPPQSFIMLFCKCKRSLKVAYLSKFVSYYAVLVVVGYWAPWLDTKILIL